MCKKLFRVALATIVALAILPHAAKPIQKEGGQTTQYLRHLSTLQRQVDFRLSPNAARIPAFRQAHYGNYPAVGFVQKERNNVYSIDFSPTRDKSELVSVSQGDEGNCVILAISKAAVDKFTKKGVFASVDYVEGGIEVVLLDGRVIRLTVEELAYAAANTGYIELGHSGDLSFYNFTFAVVTKSRQLLLGLETFEAAVYELNNGEMPLDVAKFIGLSDRLVMLTGKDYSNYDSMVAWGLDTDLSRTQGHCVFVDMTGYGQHVRDMYGVPAHYGPEVRRVRIGRFRVRDQMIMKYENRLAFVKVADKIPVRDAFSNGLIYGQGQSLKFDHNRYEDALEAAVRTGRPIVIKGGATWCGPCQQLKRTFSNQTIQSLLKEKAVFVEVEADRQYEPVEARRRATQILRELNVNRYPTTIVVSVSKTENGQYVLAELGKKVGMMNVGELDNFLKNAIKRTL